LVPTIGIYEVKREKNKVFSFSFIQATELRREGAVTEEEKFLDFYRIFTSFLRRRKREKKRRVTPTSRWKLSQNIWEELSKALRPVHVLKTTLFTMVQNN
jgi:hypothetical protein